MRVFELTTIKSDRPTILLLNGGGQQPYNKFHKATRLFKPYNCNIVSLELPGHGKSSFDHIVTVDELIQDFTEELHTICSSYNEIGLFGISLGGLLALKATELNVRPFLFTVVAGAAIQINGQQEEVMQDYTTMEFFEQMRWDKIMKDYHENWQYLMESIAAMLHIESDLFMKKNPDTPVHLILGDNDEVADHKLHEPIADESNSIMLHVLENTSHFDYFTRSWDKMQEVIASILDTYLNR